MATKKVIILNFELEDEPNEDKLTSIELGQNALYFENFSGFAARDIYNLVTKGDYKGENHE